MATAAKTGTTPYQAALDAVAKKGGKVTKMPAGQKRVPAVGTDGQPATTGATKPAPKKTKAPATGGPHPRITTAWLAKGGKVDLQPGDTVKSADVTGTVKGRWTKKSKAGNTPMIAVIPAAQVGVAAVGGKAHLTHVPAADLTRTKAAPTKK